MRSPICWFGGKGLFIKNILPLIPPHDYYLEPFFGGGNVFFAKEPAKAEVINDIDKDLINFYKVLQNEEKFKEFHKLVSLTPYSRAIYYECRKSYKTEKNDIKRAYKWFIVARMSFAGRFGSGWSYDVKTLQRKTPRAISKYLSSIDLLPQIHLRLMHTQIECDDFRKIIERYNDKDYFMYCDPPYIPETRKKGKYKYEMTNQDHKELVDLLLNYKGKVLLSGYEHPIYEPLLKNKWKLKKYTTICHAVGTTRETQILGKGAKNNHKRVECLYMNYTPQRQLSFEFFS